MAVYELVTMTANHGFPSVEHNTKSELSVFKASSKASAKL